MQSKPPTTEVRDIYEIALRFSRCFKNTMNKEGGRKTLEKVGKYLHCMHHVSMTKSPPALSSCKVPH